MITNINDINALSESDLRELEQYKSDDGTYTIPVQWSVYSTITVTADNLKDAIANAADKINDLPTSTENEYIDGSYGINIDDAASAIDAQGYVRISGVSIDSNGEIHS